MFAVVGTVLLLAVVETANALLAPWLAPSDADWKAAADWVHRDHRDGDLIVAAPAWSDPVLRLYLGDLLPFPVAARLDHRHFSRVWELSSRGATATETFDGQLRGDRRFGHLRVRLFERQPLAVTYDFFDHWANAHVTRVVPGQPPIDCAVQATQHQCPQLSYNFVKPRILEMGDSLRRALYVQPVGGAVVALEFPQVPMGRELAIGGGLHNVWLRKAGDGTVWLRALVDGRELGTFESTNRSAWTVVRFDTTRYAGRAATVRFEITSAKPFSRHFGFAAEARGR